MKNFKWGNLIKIILFFLLIIGMGTGILRIFGYKDMGGGGGWQRFYQMEEETADVMFFGSSHAHCTIDHGILWDEYGIAGYTMSAGAQKLDSTYYFVKEAIKRQKPKVVVVEMLGATEGGIYNDETDVYRNTLGMRWSLNFAEYIKALTDDMEMSPTWKKQVFTKIPIIHSRYAELKKADFIDAIPFMRGYRGSFEIVSFEKPAAVAQNEKAEIDPEKLEYLKKIISLTKEEGVELVLFASPFILKEEHQKQFHTIRDIAEEAGVPFLDYNSLCDEIGLDYDRDFRDESHVNNYGAAKVTRHMAEYLREQFEVPDKRGQDGYALWAQNALYLRNKRFRYELEHAEDINEYLQKLTESTDEQTVVVALTGNYNALGEVYLPGLQNLGITSEEYYAGGIWMFRGKDRVFYLPGQEYNQRVPVKNGEILVKSFQSVSEDGESRQELSLLVNSENCRLVENGVNIIVFNEELGQLVDAAGDDIYLGLQLIHKEKEEE